MKRLFICAFLLFWLHNLEAQETKKVLFLGNSYTAYNNLPHLVSQMAINTGDELIYDSNTPGGFRLMNHASNTITLNKIQDDNWDFVTLQAQSQETSLSESQMQTELYPFAIQLVNTIRNNNPCSQPLFYMTWGRENGDATNCAIAPWVCTYEGMDDAIKSTYIYMAEENTSEIAPVSAVWRYLRLTNPEINLYSSDGSHPSLEGSFAAACAFYSMIFKKDPTAITWNSSLTESTANKIKLATKLIVFDVLNNWDMTANFNFSVNDNQVFFTNAYQADTINWNFGDSNSSNQNNPTHYYNQTGDFEVTLSISSCGRTHTVSKNVSITNLSINENDLWYIKLYPNPTHDKIHIQGLPNNNTSAIIYSILGEEIFTVKNVVNNYFSVSNLKYGVYFIKIISGNKSTIRKIIKQ